MSKKHNVEHKPAHHEAAKHEHKHEAPKKHKKESILPAILALIAIIVIVVGIINISKILPKPNVTLATVNGEKITTKDVEWLYNKVSVDAQPEQLTTIMDQVVNYTVTQRVLMQEAKKLGIAISDSQLDLILDQMASEGIVKAEDLKDKNMKEFYRNQIIMTMLLNNTVSGKVSEPTETETKEFYDQNAESINVSYALVQDQIKQYLYSMKQQIFFQQYVEELKAKADIQIMNNNVDLGSANTAIPSTASGSTFSDTKDPICKTADGKPVIRMFSTTWCPHCQWVKPVVDKVLKEYADAGKITAYHWELDTGDNTLTPAAETAVPKDEEALFTQYNPQGGVPTFLFACKYLRIGNGYEAQQDLKAEETEFRKVIDELIAAK